MPLNDAEFSEYESLSSLQSLSDAQMSRLEALDGQSRVQETPKETFISRLGRGTEEFMKPKEIPYLSQSAQAWADLISKGAKAGEEKLGSLGAGTPFEALTTAGQGILTGIRGVANLGAMLAKPSVADIGMAVASGGGSLGLKLMKPGLLSQTELVNAAKMLRAAPAEVRAAETAKLVQQNGQKAVEEAMSIAELQAKTGTPEKLQAAITMPRLPSKFTDPRRISRPLGGAPAPSAPGKPFTVQAGLGADNQAALEAFRAKLPKGPGAMPEASPAPLSAPIREIPASLPAAPAASAISQGKGLAGNINLAKYPKPVADLLSVANKSTGFAERAAQTIPELKAIGGTPEAQALYQRITSAPEGSVPGAIANARETLNNEAKVVLGKLDNILSAGTDDINSLVSLAKKGEDVSKAAKMAGQSLRVHQEAADSKLAQQLVDKAEELKIKAKATQSPLVQPYIDGLTALQKAISKKAFDLSQTSNIYRKTMEIADKAYYVYLNSILSNPITHVRNIAGNVIFTGLKPVEKMAAATFDNIFSRLPGGKAAEHTFSEVGGQVKGAAKFITGKSEKLPFDVTAAGQKLDAELSTSLNGMADTVIGAPLHALKLEDDIAKSLIGQMEYAGLKARGLTGKALQSGVEKEAAYRTFQDEAGPIVKSLIRARDTIPGAKLVIPFLKTPAKLFERGIERSPLGFVKIAAKGLKGGYTQANLAADLGNASLGSTAAAFLAWQYGKGKISGSYPTDKNERALWEAEGKIPYAVKVNGRWRPLDRIEPIGGIVKIAIAGMDAYNSSKQDMPEDKASEIAIRLGKELTAQSALNGFNNLSQAMSDPERYAGKVVSNVATGFVPGLSKFAVDMTDPTARVKQGIFETAKAKIPGLAQTLPPKRDVLGAPIPKDLFWGSEARPAPELQFARSLDIDLPTTEKPKTMTALTTQENNDYRLFVGERLKGLLQQEMAKPTYADPTQEKKYIESAITVFKDAGKTVAAVRSELRDLDIPLSPSGEQADYLYKNIIKDKGYKTASKEQRRAAINRLILGVRQ